MRGSVGSEVRSGGSTIPDGYREREHLALAALLVALFVFIF